MEVFLLIELGMEDKQKDQPVNIQDLVISEHGSLGLLAFGAQGLKAWRLKKSEALSKSNSKPKKK